MSNWRIHSTRSPAQVVKRALASSAPSGTRFERESRFEQDASRAVSDCCTPKGYRQIFSEKSARAEARRYRRKGLDGTSRQITDLLKNRGVEGKTLLEVGGGIGASEIDLLKAQAPAERSMSSGRQPTKVPPANFSTSLGLLIASSAGSWISPMPVPKSKLQTSSS